MLVIKVKELKVEEVGQVAKEYYGFQNGPVMVIVTDPPSVSSKVLYRLEARYGFMYEGEVLRPCTPEEASTLFKA